MAERGQGLIGWTQVGTEEAPGETWEGRLLLESEGPKALGPGLHSTWQPNWGLLAVTGLDIWASLLSTGAICTFYTTVVSDFPAPPSAPCTLDGDPGLAVHSLPFFPPKEAQFQMGLFPHN